MSIEVTVPWQVGEHLYAVRLAGKVVVLPVEPVGDAPPYVWDATGLRRLADALAGLVRQAEEHLADVAADVGVRGKFTERRSDEDVRGFLPGYPGQWVLVHEGDGAARDAVEVARLVGEADARGIPRIPFVWEAQSLTEVVSRQVADKRIQRAGERGLLSSSADAPVATCQMPACDSPVRSGGTAWCEEHRYSNRLVSPFVSANRTATRVDE